MRRRATEIACVVQIHVARLRAEAGPFVLAALGFPAAMFVFASAVGSSEGDPSPRQLLRFLAGSIVFSVSLTTMSWLGYLLLENRFTGRLKLFATLPLEPSSYVLGILVFAVAQGAAGTASVFAVSAAWGVRTAVAWPVGAMLLAAAIVSTMLCVCGLAVIIAARARSFSEGSLLTDALGAGLVLLAPIYSTPEALPGVLRLFSHALPTTYAARVVHTTLAGGLDVGRDLLTLLVMAVVTLTMGFRLTRWRED